MNRARRQCLADSNVTSKALQTVLAAWSDKCGTICIDMALEEVEREWIGKGMPAANQLCWTAPCAFVELLVQVDPLLHPRHGRMVDAIVAQVEQKKLKYENVFYPIEMHAMLSARCFLRICTKFRDLAKYPEKKHATLRKANLSSTTYRLQHHQTNTIHHPLFKYTTQDLITGMREFAFVFVGC